MKKRHKPEEIVAKKVGTWADGTGVLLVHFESANPWQNPFSETFYSRARFEFLERELFGNLLEAKVLCEVYRWWYNELRGHIKLGNMTPAKYAEIVRRTERIQSSPAICLPPTRLSLTVDRGTERIPAGQIWIKIHDAKARSPFAEYSFARTPSAIVV